MTLEDDLKNENEPKDIKFKDKPKKEDESKEEDDLVKEDDHEMGMTPKLKTISKMKINLKLWEIMKKHSH